MESLVMTKEGSSYKNVTKSKLLAVALALITTYFTAPENAFAGRLYPTVYRSTNRTVSSGGLAIRRSLPRLGGGQRNYEQRVTDWQRAQVRYDKLIADREFKIAKLELRQEERAAKKTEKEQEQRRRDAEKLKLAQLKSSKKSVSQGLPFGSNIQQEKGSNRQSESLLFSGNKFDSTKQTPATKPSFWQRLKTLLGLNRK